MGPHECPNVEVSNGRMIIWNFLAKILLTVLGSLASILVLLLAIVWGMHEESSLRPGSGVDIPASLSGYNVVITGSSAGIGFEAAVEFYRLGAHVVIHSSSQKRAESSAKDVKLYAAEGQGRSTPLAADLGDFDQVRSFAAMVLGIMPKVDVLIMNAARMYGVARPGCKVRPTLPNSTFQSKTGHDSVLATNHLGHVLLTELLRPVLAHSAVIIVVGSFGSWGASSRRLTPPWGNIGNYQLSPASADDKRIFWQQKGLRPHGYLAYRDSKYANVCFGRYLRRHLGKNITVYIHDPGMVVTTPHMDRNSALYENKLYRTSKESRWYDWHAPTVDSGRHLLQNTFITRRPVPDVITTYFFPRQYISWFVGYEWETTRLGYLSPLQMYQRFTWGLHASVGPQCDAELQDRIMRWSAQATGLQK